MISEFTEMPYMEILTEGTGKPGITFHDGEVLIIGKTALCLNLKESFLDTIKNNTDIINGIIVCPILPVEVIENFKENLTDIVKYVIYDDQTCVHNLFIIAEDSGLFADACAVVDENKTMISSTQTIFPDPDDALFNCRLDDFSGSVDLEKNRYYWFEIEYELLKDNIVTKPTPPDLIPDVMELPLCPNPPAEALEDKLPQELAQLVTEFYDTHKFTFKVRKIFSRPCAGLCCSIDEDEFDIVVKFHIMTGRYMYKPDEQNNGGKN